MPKPICKVKMIVDTCTRANPDFDRNEPKGPDNRPIIPIPVGEIIEDPDAWLHCLPNVHGVTIAEPADEPTKKFVEQKLAEYEQKKREIEARRESESAAKREAKKKKRRRPAKG